MKNKLYFNNIVSLIYQVCAVIIGLILPRLILQKFGSNINGVVTSITQMLSVISLLDLGVGAVVQSALYKPLYNKNTERISEIYSSAGQYFTRIAEVLLAYVFILCIYYSLFKDDDFSWIFTSTLVLAISISYFTQYYFGIRNKLLLYADQKIYVVTLVNLFGLIANAIVTCIMLGLNANIQMVKLFSSCVFLIKPLLLQSYVRRHYSIIKIKKPRKDAIPNKWSGFAQHITVVITNSIDNIVLTFFSTFNLISVYNVYVLPLNSINNLFGVVSNSYKSFFGNIIAKNDKKLLESEFNKYEMVMHYITMVVMCTVLITLVPFVLMYTAQVTDTNYRQDIFGIMISIAYIMYILRFIYTNLIFAAGKFKETQIYCIMECIINIVASVSLVKPLGLLGVAIGTVISSGYRLTLSAYYLKKDIIYRSIIHFVKHIFTDTICVVVSISISRIFFINTNSFIEWTLFAMCAFLISIFLCSIIHLIFYFPQIRNILKKSK